MDLLAALAHLATTLVLAFVGIRLLLHARRGLHPERLLGINLVLIFVGYLAVLVAVGAADDGTPRPMLIWCGSVAASAASILMLFFVRFAFRPEERWARGLVLATSVAIAGLLLADTQRSGWPAVDMAHPLYWLRNGGAKVGMIWLLVECMASARRAQRDVRLGIGDPMFVNQMRLFGLLASVTLAFDGAFVSASAYYLEHGATSPLLDFAIAGLLASSAWLLHLAIVPPAWYRDRVMRGADLIGRVARRRAADGMAPMTRLR